MAKAGQLHRELVATFDHVYGSGEDHIRLENYIDFLEKMLRSVFQEKPVHADAA